MSVSANQNFQTPHRQPLHTDLPPVYRPPGVAATIIQFTGALWASQGMRNAGPFAQKFADFESAPAAD